MSDLTAFAFSKIESDLDFLIQCFREVLEDLGQTDLAHVLPWDEMPSPDTLPPRLGQAFSVAFQLLNLVEENAAEQTRRKREREEGMSAERGLWGEALEKLKASGFNSVDIARALPQIRVEPVLTAHPTEAKRLTVLEQHRELFRALGERENPLSTPAELASIRRRVKAILERLWRTGEILLAKPEVADERRQINHYLREIFPDALIRLDSRLKSAWSDAGFSISELNGHFPLLRFGTWVGGDRDGHPLVTANVTRDTLLDLRLNALVVMYRRIERLAEKMSLSVYGQQPPQFLLDKIAELGPKVGARANSILDKDEEEPWRQLVRLIGARLPLDTRSEEPVLRDAPGFYRFPHELRADLDVLKASLEAVGAHRLIETDLVLIYRALDTFGFHLAALDIRQNSAFHDKALSQLMVAAGIDGEDFALWSESERLRFLNTELKSPRPFLHPGAHIEGEAGAVLDCYRVLTHTIETYGAQGVGALIVSMTRSLSDLLVVFVLAREAGLMRVTEQGLISALPVVPLFETVEDLEGSAAIVRAFLEHPVARASLEKQARGAQPVQQVMVGYSDSNKDKGIFASQWALQKGQMSMAQVGQATGVKIRFFHGRGGTISRGAGPTHRFLEALPHGSLSGDVRVTEQGETIAQKYGNRATATYNLELMLAGVTANTLRGSRPVQTNTRLNDLCERLSQRSGDVYRALLNADGFIPFFREATPIDALENSRIGSRPARRTGQASLADLRAIPWVFSWNQSRFYLPGWYGLGSALYEMQTQSPEDFDYLKTSVSQSKFLRYVLTNVETNLASTDPEIMRRYADLVEDETVRESIFALIEDEGHKTGAAIEAIFGSTINARRPRMLKTLEIRAQALHILHDQQLDLLKQWRAAHKEGNTAKADEILPDLLLSINAIASGLRTTG
ncbi:phosphoenolpyruvate carboxylase [Abditibacteriota bacterium]|nr:phosphoenolpyruvate carboxylase [Abditibacteriota bacterium]